MSYDLRAATPPAPAPRPRSPELLRLFEASWARNEAGYRFLAARDGAAESRDIPPPTPRREPA